LILGLPLGAIRLSGSPNYSGEKRRFDSYRTETDAIKAANELALLLSQRDVLCASMTREQSIESQVARKEMGLDREALTPQGAPRQP
jgi:hypothetical protein